MSTTHTPGPWHTHTPHKATRCDGIIYSRSGFNVARVNLDAGPNTEANARLIAAAPDLLDVVERFQAACKAYLPPATEQSFCGLFASAAEAIAKARGQ